MTNEQACSRVLLKDGDQLMLRVRGLACAVVRQAVKDYAKECKKVVKGKGNEPMRKMLEKWLISNSLNLTNGVICGERIVERVNSLTGYNQWKKKTT